MRTGKPRSSGNGSPFIPMASIAFDPGAMIDSTGVPHVHPSTLRVASWSAPGRTPAVPQQVGQGDADEVRRGDVRAADLVRHAHQRDGLLHQRAPQQVVVGEHHFVVHHAVHPHAPVLRTQARHGERGVDAVELLVRRQERRCALAGEVGVERDLRRGLPGAQLDAAPGGLDVHAPGEQLPAHGRESGARRDRRRRQQELPSPLRHDRRLGPQPAERGDPDHEAGQRCDHRPRGRGGPRQHGGDPEQPQHPGEGGTGPGTAAGHETRHHAQCREHDRHAA